MTMKWTSKCKIWFMNVSQLTIIWRLQAILLPISIMKLLHILARTCNIRRVAYTTYLTHLVYLISIYYKKLIFVVSYSFSKNFVFCEAINYCDIKLLIAKTFVLVLVSNLLFLYWLFWIFTFLRFWS